VLIVQDGPSVSLFGVSWSHTIRHTVWLFWTSDQPVAETSAYTGQHNIQTSMSRVGFEPATYALDRAATGIGLYYSYILIFTSIDRRQENMIVNWLVVSIFRIHSCLKIFMSGILYVTAVCKYLNLPAFSKDLWIICILWSCRSFWRPDAKILITFSVLTSIQLVIYIYYNYFCSFSLAQPRCHCQAYFWTSLVASTPRDSSSAECCVYTVVGS
jgi:hypothetical protein